MNVLITGGAGYIGSIVTEAFLAAGDQIVIYDNFSTGHSQSIHPDARLVRGDVGDTDLLAKTMKEQRIDAVVHMAGFIEAGESMVDPGKYFRNNCCRPVELLEAMVAADVGKILFSSTAAIYGNPVSELIDESHPTAPTNAYGASKLLYEQMLDWYDAIHDVKHAALRYFNAAGASATRGEDHHPETHLIPIVLQVALGQREAVQIYGNDYPTRDGTCIRDYIHVLDLAQAHLLALRGLDQSSFHFNLGNGQGYSVREVIDTVRQVTGRPITALDAPRREGDPAILVAGSAQISRELGWQPQHPQLSDIVASAWEWHRRHPQGYGDK